MGEVLHRKGFIYNKEIILHCFKTAAKHWVEKLLHKLYFVTSNVSPGNKIWFVFYCKHFFTHTKKIKQSSQLVVAIL